MCFLNDFIKFLSIFLSLSILGPCVWKLRIMLGQAALLICLLIVGKEVEGQVRTTLKYQSACCLSPFEKFIDDKEVSKCGQVSDTCISLYYLILVRHYHFRATVNGKLFPHCYMHVQVCLVKTVAFWRAYTSMRKKVCRSRWLENCSNHSIWGDTNVIESSFTDGWYIDLEITKRKITQGLHWSSNTS